MENTISLQVAEKSIWKPQSVDLSTYEHITAQAAIRLAMKEPTSPSELNLNGLKSLSDEAARGLCEFSGRLLSLNGLSSLSEEASRCLARFKGECLGVPHS
jgi:hypothetical protein